MCFGSIFDTDTAVVEEASFPVENVGSPWDGNDVGEAKSASPRVLEDGKVYRNSVTDLLYRKAGDNLEVQFREGQWVVAPFNTLADANEDIHLFQEVPQDVSVPPSPESLNILPGNGEFRVFKIDNALYVLSRAGVQFFGSDGGFAGHSAVNTASDLDRLVDNGDAQELTVPETIEDRRVAAEEATGFGIGDLIASYGEVYRVIGYGRINDVSFDTGEAIVTVGGEPTRVLIVQTSVGTQSILQPRDATLLYRQGAHTH